MAALLVSPFNIYRQKTQKNALLIFAITWVLTIILSSLYLCRISYICSPTRLFCSYLAGIFFWFLAIPLINAVLRHMKTSKVTATREITVLSTLGLVLITLNQFFVYEVVRETYWILWAYEEQDPSWVNEIITNNILVNILFYCLLLHINRQSVPVVKNSPVADPGLVIKDGSTISKIDVASIRYIKVEQNCIHIHTCSRKYVVYSSLVKFSEQLPPQLFTRIHRSLIVNQTKIQQVRNLPVGDAEVVLECGTVLKCSRNFKKNLHEYIS